MQLLDRAQIAAGNYRSLARAISQVENEHVGYEQLLASLEYTQSTSVIGITGPPGAGKSSLTNALVSHYLKEGKRIAVLAVDPSSPFNYGALLGDRVRLSEHYTNPNVYMRSLATRGALGGLSEKIIEVTDVVRAVGFDYILVETVGVGQSEVEIAGLADTTIVVLVPESGDEIQAMKAGLMEVADIFVVNKADRPDSAKFVRYLEKLVHSRKPSAWNTPVLSTVASKHEGISEVAAAITRHHNLEEQVFPERRRFLLAQRALQLIQKQRMKDVDWGELLKRIGNEMQKNTFNLYVFVRKYYSK